MYHSQFPSKMSFKPFCVKTQQAIHSHGKMQEGRLTLEDSLSEVEVETEFLVDQNKAWAGGTVVHDPMHTSDKGEENCVDDVVQDIEGDDYLKLVR